MISDRKRTANLANATRSTGPKTIRGKAASSRNSLKHGLSIERDVQFEPGDEIDRISRELVGAAENVFGALAAAREVAELQLELKRIRQCRHQLLVASVWNADFETKKRGAKIKSIMKILTHRSEFRGENQFPSTLRKADIDRALSIQIEELDHKTAVLIELAAELRALHRYELRALTKRNSAIRRLDATIANDLRARQSRRATNQ